MSADVVRLINCPPDLAMPLRRALLAADLLPEGQLGLRPDIIIVWGGPGAGDVAGRELRQAAWPHLPAVLGVGGTPPVDLLTGQAAGLDAWTAGTTAEEVARAALLLGRCRQRFLQTSPLTHLPGAPMVFQEIVRRLPQRGQLAVLAFDLDHFKGYNDRYGYERGDGLLRWLAGLIAEGLRQGAPGAMLGHVGGDDFLAVVRPEQAPLVADQVIAQFETGLSAHYAPADWAAGGLRTWNRRGESVWQPLLTLTVAMASNAAEDVTHSGQVAAILAELKQYGKTLPGSVYVPDRRRDHRLGGTAAPS